MNLKPPPMLPTASTTKRSPDDGADSDSSEMPESKRARSETAGSAAGPASANTPTPDTAPWLYAAAGSTPATPQSLASTAALMPPQRLDVPTAATAPWLYARSAAAHPVTAATSTAN